MSIGDYIRSRDEYKDYIIKHVNLVRKSYFTYLQPLHTEVPFEINDVIDRLLVHDQSKFGPYEFEAYRQWFYPMSGEVRDEKVFDMAWRHHYMHNDHHPEHWINLQGEPHPMELEAVIEMMADIIAMSRTFDNNPYEWFDNAVQTKDIVLHPKTEKLIREIFNMTEFKKSRS